MAIRLIDGSVFLHIPKTGGNWVAEVLQEQGLIKEFLGHKHSNWSRLLFYDPLNEKPIGKIIKQRAQNRISRLINKQRIEDQYIDSLPFTFCFVREPMKWYESWWKYMSNRGWNEWGKVNSKKYWHPNSILNGLGDSDFNQFMINVLNKRPGYVTELYHSYTNEGINFIGKNENLKEDLIKVLTYLNLSFDEDFIRDYKKVNESPNGLKVVWDQNLKEKILELEKPAYLHYDYLNSSDSRFRFKHPAMQEVI